MSNTTLSEVVRSIMFGDLTNDELNNVAQAIKFRRTELIKTTKSSLTIGSKVSFVDRSGRKYLGNVTGIKVKNVIVNTALGIYRVPASMLTVE
jgi:hypothetical protein